MVVHRLHVRGLSIIFPRGQTYVYGAEWRVFNAGIATLRMEQAGQDNVLWPQPMPPAQSLCFTTCRTSWNLSSIPQVSALTIRPGIWKKDSAALTPISLLTMQRQGGFDQKNIKKKESKHEEHEIPGCVTDMLSSIYYVASLPLLPDKTYSFPISDGGPTLTVAVHVEARESIKTPAGTFNTIRVQPETSAAVLRDKGKVWIWYPDDAARIPVQMRARMSSGAPLLSLCCGLKRNRSLIFYKLKLPHRFCHNGFGHHTFLQVNLWRIGNERAANS